MSHSLRGTRLGSGRGFERLEPRELLTSGLSLSPPKDIVGRNGDVWWIARSDGENFNSERAGDADRDVQWIGTGDVNNDGLDDVVGWNPETGQLKVAKATADGFVEEVWGWLSPNVDWGNFQLMDLSSNDSMSVVARSASSGHWFASISNEQDGFTNGYIGRWSPFYTWADVVVGDVNADGRDDLIGRVLEKGALWVGITNANGRIDNQLWGRWSRDTDWYDLQMGDVNGDGRDDLIGRMAATGQWHVGIAGANRFNTSVWDRWSTRVDWVDVLITDINCDGRVDILGRVEASGRWWVAESQGNRFETRLAGAWPAGPDWADVAAADVNGDLLIDVVGRNPNTGNWLVGLSNGSQLIDEVWGQWNPAAAWSDVFFGSF